MVLMDTLHIVRLDRGGSTLPAPASKVITAVHERIRLQAYQIYLCRLFISISLQLYSDNRAGHPAQCNTDK